MKNPSNVFTGAVGVADSLDHGSPISEQWRVARAAHLDLVHLGMPQANLHLIGVDSAIWNVLQTLLADLREPIASWCPGERLVLPPASSAGTLILHNVGAMGHEDQLDLLEWLERTMGRVQVVSTSSISLLPRVHASAFIDTLYYRLNTVCLDVTI